MLLVSSLLCRYSSTFYSIKLLFNVVNFYNWKFLDIITYMYFDSLHLEFYN